MKDNGHKDQAARSSQQMADHVVINYWILGHKYGMSVRFYIKIACINLLAKQLLPSFMMVLPKGLNKIQSVHHLVR